MKLNLIERSILRVGAIWLAVYAGWETHSQRFEGRSSYQGLILAVATLACLCMIHLSWEGSNGEDD